jgi:hypothetical protein
MGCGCTLKFGGAAGIYSRIRGRLESPPSDSYLADYPYIHNAYIAGYIGYLELEKLAGQPESTNVRNELDRLLRLRASQFSKDNWFTDWRDYRRTLNASKNFIYLVPELAEYMNKHAYAEVKEAVDEYNYVIPCWFVSKYDSTYEEGMLHQLYDPPAVLQAKAYILREPPEELLKYLDVPAFAVGDLFYIQNLIAVLEATSFHRLEKKASPTYGRQGSAIGYTLSFYGTGDTLTLSDALPSGVSAPTGFELTGTSVKPTYVGGARRLDWSDTPPPGQQVTIRYTVVIETGETRVLANRAELSGGDYEPGVATATIIASPYQGFLPLVFRED